MTKRCDVIITVILEYEDDEKQHENHVYNKENPNKIQRVTKESSE